VIVVTAGHVDHGKTALVRALTGIDTDRLPEETTRGLSIDLGFAYRALDGGEVLGFVDVPGHERFVRNMLAGVSGVDLALLVVAADDGVMPQTREHLAILELLGVSECVVALTKIDRVDEPRVAEVEGEVRSLLAQSRFGDVEIVPVCAPEGQGIDGLLEGLLARAPRDGFARARGRFRMPVDRCFVLDGIGVIVTGTVHAGAVRVGDAVCVTPDATEARVRSIHSQDRKAETASAGQRCALNVVGRRVDAARVRRGDWVLDPAAHAAWDRIDARVRVLASESRPLKHWTPVHVHHGASDVSGRVAVLGGGAIAPGEEGLAQLVLARDLFACARDRLVLRDQSARRTIGGGIVLDPQSPRRGRAKPARIAWLHAMDAMSAADALPAVLEASPAGVDLAAFARSWNLSSAEAERLFGSVAMVRLGRSPEAIGVLADRWLALRDAVLAAVRRHHDAVPDALGPTALEVYHGIRAPGTQRLVDRALQSLVKEGALIRRGALVALPGHRVELRPEDDMLWRRAEAVLAPEAGSPPSLHQAARALGAEAADLEAFLERVARAGCVARVARNRYVPLERVRRCAREAESLAQDCGDCGFTAGQYKARAGVGRNFAIDLLEYFDRQGFTERVGEARRIVRPCAEVFGE